MGKRQFSIVPSLILKCESKPSFEALVCGRLANNSGHYHAAVWAGGAGLPADSSTAATIRAVETDQDHLIPRHSFCILHLAS